jgi:hypothetical protein
MSMADMMDVIAMEIQVAAPVAIFDPHSFGSPYCRQTRGRNRLPKEYLGIAFNQSPTFWTDGRFDPGASIRRRVYVSLSKCRN